jgi:hypothetical protein
LIALLLRFWTEVVHVRREPYLETVNVSIPAFRNEQLATETVRAKDGDALKCKTVLVNNLICLLPTANLLSLYLGGFSSVGERCLGYMRKCRGCMVDF